MVQVYALSLILFATTVVGSTTANITLNVLDNVEIVNDIDTYRKAHPQARVELIPFNATTKNAAILTHTLGWRTVYDRLVASVSKTNRYIFPQNVQVTLTYPANSAIGEKITFVEIRVTQTSNKGRAYVVSGGIGRRHIRIVVDALDTMQVDYTANFYSSASRLQSGLLVLLVTLLFFSS